MKVVEEEEVEEVETEIMNLDHFRPIVPDDILEGRLSIDDLPEPYLLIRDRAPGLEKLSKIINVLASKTDYRITFFSVNRFFGYVIMEKKEKDKK